MPNNQITYPLKHKKESPITSKIIFIMLTLFLVIFIFKKMENIYNEAITASISHQKNGVFLNNKITKSMELIQLCLREGQRESNCSFAKERILKLLSDEFIAIYTKNKSSSTVLNIDEISNAKQQIKSNNLQIAYYLLAIENTNYIAYEKRYTFFQSKYDDIVNNIWFSSATFWSLIISLVAIIIFCSFCTPIIINSNKTHSHKVYALLLLWVSTSILVYFVNEVFDSRAADEQARILGSLSQAIETAKSAL